MPSPPERRKSRAGRMGFKRDASIVKQLSDDWWSYEETRLLVLTLNIPDVIEVFKRSVRQTSKLCAQFCRRWNLQKDWREVQQHIEWLFGKFADATNQYESRGVNPTEVFPWYVYLRRAFTNENHKARRRTVVEVTDDDAAGGWRPEDEVEGAASAGAGVGGGEFAGQEGGRAAVGGRGTRAGAAILNEDDVGGGWVPGDDDDEAMPDASRAALGGSAATAGGADRPAETGPRDIPGRRESTSGAEDSDSDSDWRPLDDGGDDDDPFASKGEDGSDLRKNALKSRRRTGAGAGPGKRRGAAGSGVETNEADVGGTWRPTDDDANEGDEAAGDLRQNALNSRRRPAPPPGERKRTAGARTNEDDVGGSWRPTDDSDAADAKANAAEDNADNKSSSASARAGPAGGLKRTVSYKVTTTKLEDEPFWRPDDENNLPPERPDGNTFRYLAMSPSVKEREHLKRVVASVKIQRFWRHQRHERKKRKALQKLQDLSMRRQDSTRVRRTQESERKKALLAEDSQHPLTEKERQMRLHKADPIENPLPLDLQTAPPRIPKFKPTTVDGEVQAAPPERLKLKSGGEPKNRTKRYSAEEVTLSSSGESEVSIRDKFAAAGRQATRHVPGKKERVEEIEVEDLEGGPPLDVAAQPQQQPPPTPRGMANVAVPYTPRVLQPKSGAAPSTRQRRNTNDW